MLELLCLFVYTPNNIGDSQITISWRAKKDCSSYPTVGLFEYTVTCRRSKALLHIFQKNMFNLKLGALYGNDSCQVVGKVKAVQVVLRTIKIYFIGFHSPNPLSL